MNTAMSQLEMIRYPGDAPDVPAGPPGYRLRQYQERDRPSYWHLFARVFETNSRLDNLRTMTVEDGFFVVEHFATGRVVASAVAAEYVRAGHAGPGSLQWVMTDPDHTGKGLGRTVISAATALLASLGYDRVYLATDDWRIPAIHLYLETGWRPLLFAPDMKERWRSVLASLGCELDSVPCVVEPR